MRIVFMGTPDFAVTILEDLHKAGYDIVLVVTQPDRPKGRGRILSPSPVKVKALELGLELVQPVKVKDEDFIKRLEKIEPDMIIVAAFGQILPERLLKIPPYGCINVHASLLPSYRGAAPIQRAIMSGETKSGVTIMLMDKGLDTGDMLAKEEVEIRDDDNFASLHDKLARIGGELLIKTIPGWVEENIIPVSQNGMDSNYASPLRREDEIICWSNPAAVINNQIRALDPWPGAAAFYQGKPLKIRESELLDMNELKGLPGTVISVIKGKGFVVQTGEGGILVKKVQPVGKNTMPAPSFVNGYHLEVGYVFNNGEV